MTPSLPQRGMHQEEEKTKRGGINEFFKKEKKIDHRNGSKMPNLSSKCCRPAAFQSPGSSENQRGPKCAKTTREKGRGDKLSLRFLSLSTSPASMAVTIMKKTERICLQRRLEKKNRLGQPRLPSSAGFRTGKTEEKPLSL